MGDNELDVRQLRKPDAHAPIFAMCPGALLWLPKRSRRQVTASPEGLPLKPTVRQAV